MKKKKERKFEQVSYTYEGKVYRRTIAYYTAAEYAEKREKALKAMQREHARLFSDVADEWKAKHDEDIKFYTQICYVAPLKDLKDEFEEYPIEDITAKQFQDFLNRYAAGGRAKKTVALRKIVMSQIFDFAVLNGIILSNPISVCKIPKTAITTPRELPSEADIFAIKSHKDGTIGLYFNLLIYTGLRRGEALALNYEDIDFVQNIIHVNKVVVFENSRGVIRTGGKSEASTRTVPLLLPLKELLNQSGTDLIFSNSKNCPLSYKEFNNLINKYKKETGITCTSHQLRHYFVTLCFDAHLDEKVTQDIVGHSDISTTRNIYTHIRQIRRNEAAEQLNDFLSN